MQLSSFDISELKEFLLTLKRAIRELPPPSCTWHWMGSGIRIFRRLIRWIMLTEHPHGSGVRIAEIAAGPSSWRGENSQTVATGRRINICSALHIFSNKTCQQL
jgi:hypothetical protein